MKIFIIVILAVLILALAVLSVATVYMYRLACRRRKVDEISVWDRVTYPGGVSELAKFEPALSQGREWLRQKGKTEARRVSITSYDGLRLNARIISQEGRDTPRGIILMLHGYRSNPLHDFGGSAKDFASRGFMLCMPCQRAHGESEGVHLTYGVKERYDAAEWCWFLAKEYPGLPIIMCGISMGASTVLMASSLELPAEVCGIIADCGFTTPAEICKKVLKCDFHLPAFPLFYTASLLTRVLAGFGFNDVSALEEVAKTTLPVLVIHGKSDKFVPYEMGERIRDAVGSECVFVSVDEAGHGECYMQDIDTYNVGFEKFMKLCGLSETIE